MVIQIPNPLLLPQSYGMGEVAGMGFGSNYVMLMQIVYNYYAPRVIKEMEDGKLDDPMNTMWWGKWQRFMTKYSDQSIQNTMDRVLDIPDKVLDSIWDKMGQWMSGSQGDENNTQDTIFNTRYTPSRDREGDLARTNKAIQDLYGVITSEPTGRFKDTSGKYGSASQSFRDQQAKDRAVKANNQRIQQQRDDRISIQAQNKAITRATSVVSSTRKAGQSQIQARDLLIRRINANAKNRAATSIKGNKAAFLKFILADQKQLAVLLKRYRF